jgi:hypothetical protein
MSVSGVFELGPAWQSCGGGSRSLAKAEGQNQGLVGACAMVPATPGRLKLAALPVPSASSAARPMDKGRDQLS